MQSLRFRNENNVCKFSVEGRIKLNFHSQRLRHPYNVLANVHSKCLLCT